MSGRVFKAYTTVGLVVGSVCGGRQQEWMEGREGTEPGIKTIATAATGGVAALLWPLVIGSAVCANISGRSK